MLDPRLMVADVDGIEVAHRNTLSAMYLPTCPGALDRSGKQ